MVKIYQIHRLIIFNNVNIIRRKKKKNQELKQKLFLRIFLMIYQNNNLKIKIINLIVKIVQD